MKIELMTGCTGMGVYINDSPWWEAIEDEATKKKVEEYILQHIWDNDPFDWVLSLLPDGNEENNLGTCEQCGDCVYQYIWEIDEEE